ncbi:ornithine carbamoyltransferase [Sphingomonas ginkgonis]|uniref:Ornithine carbamoyltransferase n=1 Tax=Sphingomonas ginkgonis TaxID=2315330 RepID=A0A3R9Y3R0_9SPHN|nr:ornithine carbamoyltransferase [Sphingomonas ginkgonis]RST29505.1 ornithine carbamoyltransferase [Sphingomonas ginkgonis]
MNDLLTIAALSRADIDRILSLAEMPIGSARPLEGKGVALYFEKPSARTRNSTEMAAVQLGGHPIYLQPAELGIGTRETPEDVARTLACYHSLICGRVFDHKVLEAMATATPVPVLNMLSDRDHPLQALADLLTIRQLMGRIEGVKIAFIGEANNVSRSLADACALVGSELRVASPAGFGFAPGTPAVTQFVDPHEAIEGVDVVYTDVWVSMGDPESDEKREAFERFQVNEALIALSPHAHFLHCLPAHRGEEVTHAVMEGPNSAVWRQAENRMHSARGALHWMIEG